MTSPAPGLRREIGLWQGTALNVIDMVGVGPFVTLPLILAAMGGGRALGAWLLGALLAICDGLVTAEGIAALRQKVPHIDLDTFAKDPKVENIKDMFTVQMLVKFVQNKLG